MALSLWAFEEGDWWEPEECQCSGSSDLERLGNHNCGGCLDRNKKQVFPPNGVCDWDLASKHKGLHKCKKCKDWHYKEEEAGRPVPLTWGERGREPPGNHGVPRALALANAAANAAAAKAAAAKAAAPKATAKAAAAAAAPAAGRPPPGLAAAGGSPPVPPWLPQILEPIAELQARLKAVEDKLCPAAAAAPALAAPPELAPPEQAPPMVFATLLDRLTGLEDNVKNIDKKLDEKPDREQMLTLIDARMLPLAAMERIAQKLDERPDKEEMTTLIEAKVEEKVQNIEKKLDEKPDKSEMTTLFWVPVEWIEKIATKLDDRPDKQQMIALIDALMGAPMAEMTKNIEIMVKSQSIQPLAKKVSYKLPLQNYPAGCDEDSDEDMSTQPGMPSTAMMHDYDGSTEPGMPSTGESEESEPVTIPEESEYEVTKDNMHGNFEDCLMKTKMNPEDDEPQENWPEGNF
jgi:hypothetical protein